MPDVLLATFQLLPTGEPGGEVLVPALRERGLEAAWARWDDPEVDWASARLVAVRSTWDYYRRTPAFLAWARSLGERLLNGADVFAWNADKRYLRDLAAAGVPTVPTELLDDATLLPGLAAALERWGSVVVKPRTGAGGLGVCVVAPPYDLATGAGLESLEGLVAAPWVAQPLVASVRTVGEASVYVFGGRAVSQARKVPGGEGAQRGEIRVNEAYGGSVRPVELDPAHGALAERAVAAARDLLGRDLAYARVDLLVHDGGLVVSELELIEPGLYLDVDPVNAERFADLVAGLLMGSLTETLAEPLAEPRAGRTDA